jgi:hypothetical protein
VCCVLSEGDLLFCVLCLNLLPLPPGKNPFAVQLNDKTKLHGLSPRAKYTDRATAACQRSECQLLRIEGATWSA